MRLSTLFASLSMPTLSPLCRLVAVASLLLGGNALAQPADDPGLDDGKRPVAAPPPRAPTPVPPPVAPVPASPAMRETVDEKVSWMSASAAEKESGIDFYSRNAAATYGGPVGLLHTITGDAGRAQTFRLSINFSFFKGDSFLIKGNSTVAGDTNSHFAGDLTLAYTPWKYLEVYAALFNSSNKNERADAGRTDPQVILALGDLAFGLKGRYPVHRSFDLALHAGLRFLNSVSGISFDGKSTNFAVDLVGSFDLRQIVAKVPLRFHLNFGYLLDNSINLLPDGQCAMSTGNDSCIRSRVVQTFAYGVGAQRLRLALAIDAPVLIGPVGLQPFVEYHNEIALGDGDATLGRVLVNDPNVSGDRLTSRTMQYLTLGVRLRPVAGLLVNAAVDVGLTSPGFVYGPPTMPWSVVLGLAYAVDARAGNRTKVVTRTITRTQDVPAAPPTGRVRGVVRDAATKKALGGVLVKYAGGRPLTPQLTGDDGTFVSYDLLPGPVWLEVSRDDYAPQKVSTDVRAGGESPIEVLLTAKPPQEGTVKVRVTDETGGAVSATVRFVSSKGPVVDGDPDPAGGGYQARLLGGDYSIDVVANGYLGRPSQVQVQPGQVQTIEVQLRKKPKVSHASLGKGEIVLKGVINFDPSNAEVRGDSKALLDEVIDVLVANPQIKRIRVEGHTDNKGRPESNLSLSKARARAVASYLVKQGIDAARIESEGYGATQPLAPNITAANRARNRRVAFKIVE